jgi:hypothetical protein
MRFLKKVLAKVPVKEMPYPDLIREHEKLVQDLEGIERISKDELDEQSSELKKYKEEYEALSD